MSASTDAISRRPGGDPRIAVLVALPLVAAVTAAALARAGLPSGVVRLSASDAERAGSAIAVTRRAVGGAILVEVGPAQAGTSLLAVSGDGRLAALADRVGELSGTLTLAMDDGAQLRIPFPGLLGTRFAPDGSWLAVIDGRGALWKMDVASGDHDLVLDGPFLGPVSIADDGSLLLLSVPSVEAPHWSRLVRVAIDTGSVTQVSNAELVYAAFALDGGELAIVVHEGGSTSVHRLTSEGEQAVADLGAGAVNVAVAHGGRIAFERNGAGIFVIDAPGSTPRSLGVGSQPCFGPDGDTLLVRRDSQRIAIAVDGSILAAAGALSAFAGSEGCLP